MSWWNKRGSSCTNILIELLRLASEDVQIRFEQDAKLVKQQHDIAQQRKAIDQYVNAQTSSLGKDAVNAAKRREAQQSEEIASQAGAVEGCRFLGSHCTGSPGSQKEGLAADGAHQCCAI